MDEGKVLAGEARAKRLFKVAAMLANWIDEDFDQPACHQIREALGEKEDQHERIMSVLRTDIEDLLHVLERASGKQLS